MEAKKQIDIVFEALELTGEVQSQKGEVKIRLIERELLNDHDCEDLNCMVVELFDQGSIFWEEAMAAMDLMIQFKVYKDDQWMGSISLQLKDLFVYDGGDFKQWFTLFDSPTDDIFDGDVGIDDQECPRVLLSFQFQDVEEETNMISRDPSIATSTFGEDELVVRSVQDGELARGKEQSSFGDLGLARESVNLEESQAYASEHGLKLDFQSNQTEPMVAPLWKLTGSFLKSENPMSASKHKLSQNIDFGSPTKHSKDSSSRRSKPSPKLDSNKKSINSEKQFSPLRMNEDHDETEIVFVAQPSSQEKINFAAIHKLEEQLATALLEVERLKLIAKERENLYKAQEESLRTELWITKDEKEHLQAEIKHAREQALVQKKSSQAEKDELLEKVNELSHQNLNYQQEIDRLEKQLATMDGQTSESQTRTGKSTNTTILGISHSKTNSELVFTPLSKAREGDTDEELASKVKAFFAKKCPNLEVKPAGKSKCPLLRPL
jgi:hypothetical protein